MSSPRLPGANSRRTWSRERAERFARDWNEGLSSESLREKYNITNPTASVHSLRIWHPGLEFKSRSKKKAPA